ncbi:MAG: Uncharacterized protein K0R58_3679 [Ramlibacter sp.]|jgi:tripartite-type tricarboxylate transporter receptor subunit TctC|nr:Uncharacterized protein [Ramlibacter sp.]
MTFIRILCPLLVSLAVAAPAAAQECPGPIRIVVGLSPGGGLDALARMVAQRWTEKSGKTVIVENRAGAGGNIAASYVAKAQADGCTILTTGNNHTINPAIYAKAGYELKDFASIIRAVEGTAVLTVHPSQPFKDLASLVEYAKANPKKLSYSSSGVGFPNHVAMELFLKAARIDIVHVPYKGSAPALADAVAGVVPVAISSGASALTHIQSGRLRALAVSAPVRWPTMPGVPSMAEAGYREAGSVTWLGFFAPAATPAPVVAKLNQDFRAIFEEGPIRDKLRLQGYETISATSQQDFDTFLREEERVTRKLVQDLQLKVE